MTDGESGQNFGSLTYIGWLYLVQGIPYGLQDKFIPLQLRSKGLSYTSVSLLKALFVPWATKGLWAPVVEVWGGRQRWLFISLLALAITAYTGSHIFLENVTSIGCMLLSLNMFSAVQDVTVDGMALDILPDEQVGLGNMIQVVFYKVGWLVGGAGFTYLVELTDWSMTFIILALIYLITAILITVIPADEMENGDLDSYTSENSHNSKEKQEQSQDSPRLQEAINILKEVVMAPGTLWLTTYILLYKMGERGAINNMPLFLLDKGMSKSQLAFWNGIISQGLSILGSFYGGIVLASKNTTEQIKELLLSHSLYRFLAILLQLILITVWDQDFLSASDNLFILQCAGIFSICCLSYSSGLISTGTFTLMMQISRLCERKTQASHYSAMASVEVAGKLLFAIVAGVMIDYSGMVCSFAVFSALALIPLILLWTAPVKLGHFKTE